MKKIAIIAAFIAAPLLSLAQESPRAQLQGKILYCKSVIASDERDIRAYTKHLYNMQHHFHHHTRQSMGDIKVEQDNLYKELAARQREEKQMIASVEHYQAQLNEMRR